MHTLFGIIFWNNCAWLNMFCALLNAAHFEWQWVWLSFYISFYKDGTPCRPLQVCTNVCNIFANTGAWVIRVTTLHKIGLRQEEKATLKKWDFGIEVLKRFSPTFRVCVSLSAKLTSLYCTCTLYILYIVFCSFFICGIGNDLIFPFSPLFLW